MKRQTIKLLKLNKQKISKLDMLNMFGGAETEIACTGVTFYPTMANCNDTEITCESVEQNKCTTFDTTETIGNDSFGEACHAPGTLLGC